ncbi:ankyrin repeat-containing domain protein [Aspergillus cavernicola]|uniref:Ankyrin repeat-containing domain protein n=1 Tax=Aspergillus cavernicola TaxID=176166 RepID=A0ABR4HHU4_9EURO
MDSNSTNLDAAEQTTTAQSNSGAIFYSCGFNTSGGNISIGHQHTGAPDVALTSRHGEADNTTFDPSQWEVESKEILQWLSTVQYRLHHRTVSRLLLEGTGQWLFEKPQYREWYSSETSSILWLHGIPGSGKTCLTSIAIEKSLAASSTANNALSIAYFYFSRNKAEAQRSDPTEALSAILKQLLCSRSQRWQHDSPTTRQYRLRKREAEIDGSEIERLSIMEVTEQIIHLAKDTPIMIFIDALDECCPNQRYELFEMLDEVLVKATKTVKVLVSSRDDANILLKLGTSPNISISSADNALDINRFVETEIHKAINQSRLLDGKVTSDLQQRITDRLIKKADGMFLWASLQIQHLCDSRHVKVEAELLMELAAFPDSLVDTYSFALNSIKHIRPQGRNIAESVLKWLLCAKKATYEYIAAFCAADTSFGGVLPSVETILDVCCNLVKFDDSLSTLTFAHVSVREFLESQRKFFRYKCNSFVVERLFTSDIILPSDSNSLLRKYYLDFWWFHYNMSGRHRKRIFDLHVKDFMFDGLAPSEKYLQWATNSDKVSGTSHWPPPGNVSNPIQFAAHNGWLEVLYHCERSGNRDNMLGSALILYDVAIEQGQLRVLQWLLDHNIPLDDSAIYNAFVWRNQDVVRFFFSRGVLTIHDKVAGRCPLILAVLFEMTDVVQYLVEAGADIDSSDSEGCTPLFYAVVNDRSESIVRLLLDRGADPNKLNCHGQDPLTLAVEGRHQIHCRLMLETGLCRSAILGHGQTLLQLAFESLSNYAACILVAHAVDPRLHDETMRTHWMTLLSSIPVIHRNSHQENGMRRDTIVSVLLFGEILADDLVSQALLSIAAQLRHVAAVELLLDTGVDPTCPAIRGATRRPGGVGYMCDDGVSSIQEFQQLSDTIKDAEHHHEAREKLFDELRQGPLSWAALTGNVKLIQTILDRGFDPNTTNRKGDTALFFATQYYGDDRSHDQVGTDKESVVRVLLDNGALVNYHDAAGTSLVKKALQGRYPGLVSLLVNAGADMPPVLEGMEPASLRSTFGHGENGIRQLLQRRVAASHSQDSISSASNNAGDPLEVVSRLIIRGAMPVSAETLRAIWSSGSFSTISGPGGGNGHGYDSGFAILNENGDAVYDKGELRLEKRLCWDTPRKFHCEVWDGDGNSLGKSEGKTETNFIGIAIGQDSTCVVEFEADGEGCPALGDDEDSEIHFTG